MLNKNIGDADHSVPYYYTIKTDTSRHPFLFLAGAVGFEPTARGFGVNPRSHRLRAFLLRKITTFQFIKNPQISK